ncbi:LOW QUALITY PROTEIN: hypothetical protein HID58_046797 [Brassica napus]|uniref:Uncharacterized protein n=1 Tax=Brassica napus TaxID=3708 RepID=A0ABQ8AXK4_BRANA|nr:LOW QUALITY PROTEIN: hypothetical protein HID58_046797 [Brassica napus]
MFSKNNHNHNQQEKKSLVLPLPRTDEIHIPNPSWMQSPSYEEAWNEPHIWFRPNKLCAKRQKMLEDMEKDFEGGQEADKFDGGEGSKSSGSLDIRLRVEKVQAPLCDWKTATLEYSL